MDTVAKSLLRGTLTIALVTGLSLCVAACGGGALLPADNNQAATSFTTYDQVVDAFDQIVPGRTQLDDLPNIGFDARNGNVDVLSYLGVQERFIPRDSLAFDRLDPAVQSCILSETACTGYVFHPAHTASKRIGNTFLDLMGFERITRSEHWSAEVVLLVQNDMVIHKVFSGSPRTENLEDKVQPLGPLQDLGGAVAHAAGNIGSY